MGDLKPIGSEKLSGDEKLKRILELTYYKPTDKPKKMSELIKETTNGVYGIVKEKDGFYVKRGLTENSLDYIGGLFMKNKNRFSSYNEAFKKLDFLIEQDKVQEATKYVLKPANPVPQEEAPIPAPTTDATTPPPPPAPVSDDGSIPPPPPGRDMGSPEGEEKDSKKIIQKLAGRLGEKLRDAEDELKSEDIKSAINSVLSAIDLSKLEEDDKEEIMSKLEGDEDVEGDEKGLENEPSDKLGGDETPPPPPAKPEDDLGEMDGISQIEELIGDNPFADEFSVNDDDDDIEPDFDLGPEDYKAAKAAKHDMKMDEPVDEPEENPLSDKLPDFNQEKHHGHEVKELDINELTDAVNGNVKQTLSNYFEQ